MRIVSMIALLALASCAHSSSASKESSGDDSTIAAIKKRAAFDLSCPEASIQVQQLQEGGLMTTASYGAKGCDKSVSYLERMGTIIKQ